MAASSDFSSADFKSQQNSSKSRKKLSKIEVRPTKERICNMVLRDEDEESDDEDLTLDSNSPVSILLSIRDGITQIKTIFIKLF